MNTLPEDIDVDAATQVWDLAHEDPIKALLVARLLSFAAKQATRLRNTVKGENALRDAVALVDVALEELGLDPRHVRDLERQVQELLRQRRAQRRGRTA